MNSFLQVNTDHMEAPEAGESLHENRAAIVRQQKGPTVSIIVQAYNRLEKTKRCVESVLNYTRDIDYELILIDNGSTDGTLAYFQSVPFSKKKILHITKNIGSIFPVNFLNMKDLGRFVVLLPNDLIVTTNWLSNLLVCANSDPKIGMVTPVSSNVSNLQCVNFPFQNYEEMQEAAARFNQSDSRKWEDRQRIITVGSLYKKEALLACGWPINDVGYFHDFSDDDIGFRVRRMGYRTILAGDTWIHHDHNHQSSEEKDQEAFKKSLEIGRRNFQEKYYGVDAWDDVNNFYIPFLSHFPEPKRVLFPKILGVDVRCGTPILDIKNWLRKFGIMQAQLSAFVEDPKYWLDLKTICEGAVLCDREEFLGSSFSNESFEYVVADRAINRYHEPQKMIDTLFSLCKSGGFVVCKLANTYSFREFLNMLGQRDVYRPEIAYQISLERFIDALKKQGTIHAVIQAGSGLDQERRDLLDSLLPQELPEQQRQDAVNRMQCEEFLFVVEKE